MTAQPAPRYINDESQLPSHTPAEPLFSEAPAVCFTQLYGAKDGQIVQFNLTCRANTGPDVIDLLLDTIKYAKNYGLSTIRPDVSQPGPKSPSTPATPQLPSQTQAPVSAPVVPGSLVTQPSAPSAPDATAQPSGKSLRTLHATKLTISPQADDKVKLEWFETGHSFPDIYSTRTVEKAIEILAPTGTWMSEHFAKPGTYNIRHRITWQESDKLNTKGNPYKNIVSIDLD